MRISEQIRKRIKKEIRALYDEGFGVLLQEAEKQGKDVPGAKATQKDVPDLPVEMTYQSWYSKALPVIRQLLPERLDEFVEQYRVQRRKKIDYTTYGISDYLLGIRVTEFSREVVNPWDAFQGKFLHQLFILRAAADRVESILSDIEGVLQAELFDSQIEAAEDLHRGKHLRAAGALAGVTLEAHLAAVAQTHGIRYRKKNPTISDYNQGLREAEVIDIPTWRHIQFLGDVRNLCVHAKEREPTADEVADLIQGTKKVVSTVF